MPGYGVPADPDGLLPWSWAEERLTGCRNYWVVTADASGRPHSMPVWGVWSVEDSVFWFSASHGSRKVRNLSENPQMVVTTDDSREVVSVEGRAHPLDDAGEHRIVVVEAIVVDEVDEDLAVAGVAAARRDAERAALVR